MGAARKIQVEEVYAAATEGGLAVDIVDEYGNQLELILDRLHLADLLGDAIECLRVRGEIPESVFWNPEADVVEIGEGPGRPRPRPRKRRAAGKGSD